MIDLDIISLNRQFLIMCRETAKQHACSAPVLTGLSRPVLDRLAKLSLDEIEGLAAQTGSSLFTLRLTESELNRLLAIEDDKRSAYMLAVVASGGK